MYRYSNASWSSFLITISYLGKIQRYQYITSWLFSPGCFVRSAASYVVTLIPCLMYSVYFGGFLAAFVIEKMGMIGSHPPPYGWYRIFCTFKIPVIYCTYSDCETGCICSTSGDWHVVLCIKHFCKKSFNWLEETGFMCLRSLLGFKGKLYKMNVSVSCVSINLTILYR